MHQLRDYQTQLKNDVYESWAAGNRYVLAVAPTGSGKTETWSSISADCRVPAVAIAHRQELVGQISDAHAGRGVVHRLIAPKDVIRFCITQHIEKFGKSFYHAQSPMAIGGIDTLNRRADTLQQWINMVRLWGIDEAHHVLLNNKWGKGVTLFPQAYGVGFTASPVRADRRSLGAERSGVFHAMVIGPTMRDLINRGYLCEYKVFGPPQSIDTSKIDISDATGEYNPDQLRAAAHKSTITGDIVEHYLRLAPGKRGITFCVDVEIAVETAKAFQARGVPAEAISAETPNAVRAALIKKFRAGSILQLVNVDLFGEGFDVPDVEVVSMGRPTQSYALYLQQFGRAMRISPGKLFGIVIDHVGNVKTHKLPDRPRVWSLNDEERGKRKTPLDDKIPLTTCLRCYQAFEATKKYCPHCGFERIPAGRGSPELVDGDLVEYSPELLMHLGAQIKRIDSERPSIPPGIGGYAAIAIANAHGERYRAQLALREAMALWAGIQTQVYDRTISESHRRFYFTFGIDAMTAQTLGRPDAEKLTELIRSTFT